MAGIVAHACPARAQGGGDGEHLAQLLVRHPARRPGAGGADRGPEAARPRRGAGRHSGDRLQLLACRRLGLAAPAAGARRRDDRRLRPRRDRWRRARSPTAWSGTCAIAPGGPARRRSRSARTRSGTGWRGSWPSSCRSRRRPGVRLAAHPDDPPVERLRGTARLVNSHAKYDRLLALAPSPANALEFCIGSLAEMAEGDVCATTRRFARAGAIAYVHFRNVRGQVPRYVETFVDDGDVDMAAIVRVLREEGFDGRAGARPRAGARLPGAVARRPRLYRRLHEGAGRADAAPGRRGRRGRWPRRRGDRRAPGDGRAIKGGEKHEPQDWSHPRRRLGAGAPRRRWRPPARSSGGRRTGTRRGPRSSSTKFEAANPGITVKLEITTSDGLPQRVLTALQSGARPTSSTCSTAG